MNILAFDTCFDACSVCVAQTGADRAVEFSGALERFETGHAERLIPMVEEVMSRAGLTFSHIDRLAVTVGPGTFTGTRIGVAAARALAPSPSMRGVDKRTCNCLRPARSSPNRPHGFSPSRRLAVSARGR
jgi:tRNA threonylcarbamoyladenosine biosynthesis protein TsaB